MNKKPIKGYEGLYSITDTGRVFIEEKDHSGLYKRLYKSKYASEIISIYGYVLINLFKNKKGKSFRVHRLVAETFIKNPKKYPCVNHINGIRTDNKVSNLEWCTQKQNVKNAMERGTQPKGEKQGLSKLKNKDILKIRSIYREGKHSQRGLAKLYDVRQRTIWAVINYKTWKHIK